MILRCVFGQPSGTPKAGFRSMVRSTSKDRPKVTTTNATVNTRSDATVSATELPETCSQTRRKVFRRRRLTAKNDPASRRPRPIVGLRIGQRSSTFHDSGTRLCSVSTGDYLQTARTSAPIACAPRCKLWGQ